MSIRKTPLLILISLALGGSVGYLAAPKSSSETATTVHSASTKKILYYRNPMGLPDTSPVPKKDPMGMDYIPVYEGEQDDEPSTSSQIKISTEKVQRLGVRTEPATLGPLDKTFQVTGQIEVDERRTHSISPKFEGYVERLYVNTTGQFVAKGQPLFEVYSPELVSAQREYAIAAQGIDAVKAGGADAQTGVRQLADSSLARLRNWDISEEQLKSLAKSGEAKRTLTYLSPANGVITEKKAVQGMRFMPGESLYQVTDLSSVWVIADVYEQDIGQVKTGSKAKVRINAYPDKVFEGTITYVYPTLKAETRTVPVRVELPNPEMLLKPAMFAQVELAVGSKKEVVTVPNSAVIDSGTRRIVLVQVKEGRFEPREVRLGQRSDDYIEVIEGIKSGEHVVVAANFLIDAESNLRAAIGGFGHSNHSSNTSSVEQQPLKPSVVGHSAHGKIEDIDPKAGTAMIAHEPVASLKWPGMTMEFGFANSALMKGLLPHTNVTFEFVERKPGEWVITSIKPIADKATNPHAGH